MNLPDNFTLTSRVHELRLQKRSLLRAMRCVLNSLEQSNNQHSVTTDLMRSVLAEAIKEYGDNDSAERN